MRKLRTFDEFEASYFKTHPEEIDDYINILFDDFQETGNAKALLASLRVLSQVKGIRQISRETGISRTGIQKALSEDGNPTLMNLNAIMKAMGYRLTPEKLHT